MIPAARHHRTPLHASCPSGSDSIAARASSSERWRCSTRLLVVVYNGHSCAAAVVCRENTGRATQRWQPEPGTAPTRALSAPLAWPRGRLDPSRTVQGITLKSPFGAGLQVKSDNRHQRLILAQAKRAEEDRTLQFRCEQESAERAEPLAEHSRRVEERRPELDRAAEQERGPEQISIQVSGCSAMDTDEMKA